MASDLAPVDRRILVVLPSPMMARNFLHSGALTLLGKRPGTSITVVSRNPDDRPVVLEAGATWVPYFHPRRWRGDVNQWWAAGILRWGRYLRYLAGLVLHMSLTYRFNTHCGFRGFAARLRQSWQQRKIYLREGLPMSRVFGFPWPRSRRLYELMYRAYYAGWQGFGPVDRLLDELRPDLIIMSMVQTHMVTPYAVAAVRHGVPIFGINGSWDQPTTKGPLCPDLQRIVVQNEIVRDELVRYHGVDAERIAVIGWLQMDAFVRGTIPDRNTVCRRLGLSPGQRYLLFAANAPRLGLHEPEVFRDLIVRRNAGALPADIVLVCRCHPQDRDWQRRWGWAVGMEGVIVEPPDLGPFEHLASVIRHASVVLASAGSINLDAVALDTPTIGMAWEDERLHYWDRPARAYDLEHLAELRTSRGMMFARNLDELVSCCSRYLADRGADVDARAELRQRYLHRLDGKAAARLVEEVESVLT
jgi:hypothetical protein